MNDEHDPQRERLILRGLDATQQLLSDAVVVARQLGETDARLRALTDEVRTLARILRDGNGDSIISKVAVLRENIDTLSDKFDTQHTKTNTWLSRVWDLFAAMLVGGALAWLAQSCDPPNWIPPKPPPQVQQAPMKP